VDRQHVLQDLRADRVRGQHLRAPSLDLGQLRLVFIQDETSISVPVGLNLLIYGDVFSWGQLMAGSVITTIPVMALHMVIHRWMVEGPAAGAVKG
jgi:ABC-type maltose transport system permease subunit